MFPDNCFNEHTLAHTIRGGECWVEEKDGKIVGYALGVEKDDLLDILRIGVRDAYRQRGIASRLLMRIMQGRKNVMLCVRRDNKVAVRLYFEQGFQVAGVVGDSWVMRYIA